MLTTIHKWILYGNYNIELKVGEEKYDCQKYEQELQIEMYVNLGVKYIVLEIKDGQIQGTINIKKDKEKLTFTLEQLTSYILLQSKNGVVTSVEEAEEDATVNIGDANSEQEIDDYESDKNYYLGLNYTEDYSEKENSNKYNDSNLTKVTVNYYGYDYSLTEFQRPKDYDVTLDSTVVKTNTGSITTTGNNWNRYYQRTDTITITVNDINLIKEVYSDYKANSEWTVEMNVPDSNFSDYFYQTGTDDANSSNGISVSINNNTVTVKGESAEVLETDVETCTFTFYVTFRSSNESNVNNVSYEDLGNSTFKTVITVGEYTPYGTISDTEQQIQVSYKKCVPVDSSGNIEIELIDNPFMNRPLERGFNGWTTNDSRYAQSISTNNNTYTQTLKTNLSNIKSTSGEYVIELYADWVEANIIFVSSSGSNSNSGETVNSPIYNDWSTISSKLNSNIKTCTNASNREVNIVVLMSGTLSVDSITNPNTPYTLTSLYNGVNYGSSSTYLNVGSTTSYLDSDLQLDYLYVSSSYSYTSPGNVETDGSSSLSACLYGNMYNLRIGRGIVPTNSSYCTWAQIQGGYYNHTSNEYKLVVESGKYYTLLLHRANGTNSSSTYTANGTLVLGSDIDRVKNNNEDLRIYDRIASRTSRETNKPYTGNDSNALITTMYIKSGTIGVDFFNSASTSDDSDRNYAGIYVGGHGQTGYDKSDRKIVVEGGNIANLIGGLNVESSDMYKTYMYVKGGNIINITGGAGYTHTYGDRIIQVTGGCIKYSISGGSNGVAANSTSNNGQLTGESIIYIGGDAQIGASYVTDENGNKTITETDTSLTLYGVNAGNVCGGANGNTSYAGQTDASYIVIDGNAIIHNNVFGGGNYGIIGGSTTDSGEPVIEINDETASFTTNKEYIISTSTSGGSGLTSSGSGITNATISNTSIPSSESQWIFESASGSDYYIKNASSGQYLYVSNVSSSGWGWGGNSSYTGTVTLSSSNKTAFSVSGTNSKTISYSYSSGRRSSTLYLKASSSYSWYSGEYTYTWSLSSSNSSSNGVYLLTYTVIDKGDDVDDGTTLVNIKLYGGTVKNNIYGGANQNNINGTVNIDINKGNLNGTLYGGSNLKGTVSGSALIDISGGILGQESTEDYTSVDAVFGGGLGQNTIINGRTLININDESSNLTVYGNIYGGSSLGSINGNVIVNIKDIYSSQNAVDINGYVFGGGKGDSSTAATVNGNITVNVDGCTLNNCSVFGASNINGDTKGQITVKVGENNESILYAVYGGGNQAGIGTDTQSIYVYILDNANVTNAFNGGKAADLLSNGTDDKTRAIYLQGGTVTNMYGGSDSSGTVTASHVYVEYGNAENVYGGNNLGGTTEVTNVEVTGGKIQNVYGGGEKAETTTTNITTESGAITNVYGGGNQAGVTTTNVLINGGNVTNVFGGSNTSGNVTTSNVTTNAGTTNSENSLAMTVNTTVEDSSWRKSQYPDYPTYAKIEVTYTNNSSNNITTWNSSIVAENSILYSNYSGSEIKAEDGVYTLTQANRWDAAHPVEISAGGSYSISFEILSKQSIDEFTVGYEVAGKDSNENLLKYNKSKISTVYGGNNQGGITETSNVTINGEGVQDVYGGGNQAITNVTNVTVNGKVGNRVFGGGNQAGVNTDANVTLLGATIENNVYGGGNEGTITGNTYVNVKNSTLNSSLYAGGNGASATVYGNTNLTMEGTNSVANNVFGGGNQAATGTEANNNSSSTVNIVGASIGGNLYGGANTSVVYGTTQTNIGYNAVGNTSLEIGNIEIKGTVFGGGEANASGSETYDFSFISVTNGINIEIDAKDHTKFSITGSIFGSGNASSTSGKSYININNYGTADNPQSNISIQRADCATISNSAISLSGATDRTNEYSAVFFSLSRVDQVKLKNNSVLYLCNGANLLKNLDSLVDNNGVEEKAVVTIDEETGEVIKRNVDNRIYMLEGKNLNVATNEQATAYGQVHGMFFLGLFTSRKNPGTSTGFYHKGYENGDEITNAGTFSSNSYVMAQHMTEHDITVDGFYTNYNKDGKINVNYVDTTPKDDVYYIWLVGEELDVTKFQVELSASKYATLGTYELSLKGFSSPNLKFSMNGFSSGLADGISLVDPSEINTIETDDEKANSVYGLSIRTGNVGWQTKGTTKFLTQNGGSYTGLNDYDKDNSSYTPTLNICFYHSENITKKQALGDVRIRLQVLTPVDDLNYSLSYIDIEITLSSALYQNDFYEAAITPGQEYGLFTTTETVITNKSVFSTYYSLYVQDFSESKYYTNYQSYNRVLVSRDANDTPYVFPKDTKITMLDMVTNKYYYYIVTQEDITNNKYMYNLSDFIAMGSNDSNFDELEATTQYYNSEKDLIYENFIFHVNFADTNIEENIENNSLLMELQDSEGETILGVLGIQRDSMVYTVYKGAEATIELDANISPETVYLGKTIDLNVITKFTQDIVDSRTVYDTSYFDKKLGIKISIYDSNGNHLNLDSLFGINFELDGKLYYPRVDGTTRINIADKVTDVLAKLKVNTTGNTTLASGDYKVVIESFGSPDGIYYGLTASDKIELDLRVINSSYGLKVTNKDESKIINKKTGNNEASKNSLMCTVEYSSKFTNPSITVALYRRDYSEEYAQSYELVDLKDYVSNNLTATNNEKEYLVSDSPEDVMTNNYTLNENLTTGTYKIVYKLYDDTTYVGEAFDYIIIK